MIKKLVLAMGTSALSWQMNFYGGARHGFTNPDAGNYGIPALAYNPAADERSWESMLNFFEEIFR
jgi:dienelactone hydrolase